MEQESKYKYFMFNNSDLSDSKVFNGILLCLLFTIFTLTYASSVISPQVGWWQYYAWRMEEGDILYKDIYLFITPYFVFLTRLFYSLFHEHLILYTLFVGFPVKLLCVLTLYHMLCKIAKPVYACMSTFVGACLSASYFTDLLYDFNPITILPCLLVASCYMTYFKQLRDGSDARLTAFAVGYLIGIILGLKQTFGITFGFTITALNTVIILRKEHKGTLKTVVTTFFYSLTGLLLGILPMIAYLTINDCWYEFYYCITEIKNAKGGMEHIFQRWMMAFDDFKIWVYVAIIYVLWRVQQHFWGNGSLRRHGLNNWKKNYLMLAFATGMVTIIIVYSFFPNQFHQQVFSSPFIQKWHVRFYRILIYAGVLTWLVYTLRYFKGHKVNRSFLVFTTFIVAHFFTGITSTDFLEPIYLLLYLPWMLVIALNAQCRFKRIKNTALLSVVCLLALYCISVKITVPYSWQGWSVSPISNSHVACSVEGLEGFTVSPRADTVFGRITKLIKENTTDSDQVYQFANIPLFNVITKRQIPTYVPIAWFDVCSDSLARRAARELHARPPKVVVWHNMNEGNWQTVEKVFRGKKRSGQRDILNFYHSFVKPNYQLLYSADNNRDGKIEVWVNKKESK